MPQERREKEAKQKAEDSDKPADNKTLSSDIKEDSSEKANSDKKEEISGTKADTLEAKAEGDKEVAIDLRPLTMEDLRQAKNQVSCCPDSNFFFFTVNCIASLYVYNGINMLLNHAATTDCRLLRASPPRVL
jgi:hypothetical protein